MAHTDATADAAFYFDLASPLAYLAAERVLSALPQPIEWQPVLARELAEGEPFDALRCAREGDALRENVARQALALGLQPIRWPADFPFDSEHAMRVATYAKSIGRTVPFAQAAFRQAFAGGNSLAHTDNVLIAAAACEMHPTAVLKGAQLKSVREQLAATTAQAAQAGVGSVPAIRIGGQVFAGERALEQARATTHARAATP
jgi:2-hydroxychromene-2-carboxylate isomerase